MDVQVVVAQCPECIFREEIIVYERLGGFRRELHHHACRSIGIHVGVFAGHVVRLGIDDFQEHLACLGLAGNASLVAIGNVALGHLLARRCHQFQFHHVLDFFDRLLFLSLVLDTVHYLVDEDIVLAIFGRQHSLANGSSNLLAVESHDTTIAFYNCQYHIYLILLLSCYGDLSEVGGQSIPLEHGRTHVRHLMFPKVSSFS